MRIHLLGTGGAEGIPGFFSSSRVSEYARQHKGKDIRTRAAAIVDDTLKIDLPPDTLAQLIRAGLKAEDWTALIFTHSHEDHFAVSEIQYSVYPFNDKEFLEYVIYGNDAICQTIAQIYPDWPLECVRTQSFEPFVHLDYLITPISANHKPDEDSQNLVIQRGPKTLIYATDTGIWGEETWDYLTGVSADALVIECTNGLDKSGYDGHLSVSGVKHVVERLKSQKTLPADAVVVTTHHGHLGDATHAELEAELIPYGIQVGYDDMVLEI